MNRLVIVLIYILAAIGVGFYASEIYSHYFLTHMIAAPPPPIGGSVGPVSFYINEDTPWQSIIKLISVVVGTYLGIKLINKYITN